MDNHVKILFRFYSKVLEEETVEIMWAIIIDDKKGLYKIDSIPFYAPSVSSDDIVYAEYDEDEQQITYRYTVEYSGNSIIWVVVMDKAVEIEDIRAHFHLLECLTEKLNKGCFTMEVPSKLSYKPIKQKLKQLQASKIIDFAEPCISEKHQSLT